MRCMSEYGCKYGSMTTMTRPIGISVLCPVQSEMETETGSLIFNHLICTAGSLSPPLTTLVDGGYQQN